MTQVNQLVPQSRYRPIARGGGVPLDAINATMKEAIVDINNIQAFINERVWPVMQGFFLGQGLDVGMDAVVENGASGRTVPTDHLATNLDIDLLWSVSNRRRLSIKESILLLSDKIDDAVADLQALVAAVTGGTSYDDTEVRGLIGANTLGIEQLARDMMGANYWSAFTFTSGSQTLTNSLGKLLKAVLDLHNGTSYLNEFAFPGTAISLSHTYAISQLIADVCLNPAYVCTSPFAVMNRASTVATLQDDINRIKWEIGDTRGLDWEVSVTPAYGGGPVNLQAHVSEVGSGTANGNNPHGLRLANLTDWAAFLAAYSSYTGSDGFTDSTPDYTSTVYINVGDSLEIAISKIDTALDKIDVGTTKGDLITRHATSYARLPVGTDGQIIEADSAQALGIKWGDSPLVQMLSEQTLHPNSIGTTHGSYGAHAQLSNYLSTGAAWVQTSRNFPNPTGVDILLNCWVTIPRIDRGTAGYFYPSKIGIYANLVQANTDAGTSTFRLTLFNYTSGGSSGPVELGEDLDPGGVAVTVDQVLTGWTGDALNIADFGIVTLDDMGLGQLNFSITRLNAGDTNTRDIHLLSVGVCWYGPLVS